MSVIVFGKPYQACLLSLSKNRTIQFGIKKAAEAAFDYD